MKTVFKYPLERNLAHVQTIKLPKGARPLTAVLQGDDDIAIYALVDPRVQSQDDYLVAMFMTGRMAKTMPPDDIDNYHHLATIPAWDGALMLHVFILKKGEF